MAFIRRLFRPSAVNSGDKLYRLIKIQEDGFFELDTTALHKSLEANGIPQKYAAAVRSMLWKAGNEITYDLRSQYINAASFRDRSPRKDIFWGAISFVTSAELWFLYSQFDKEEKKYSHPTKDA